MAKGGILAARRLEHSLGPSSLGSRRFLIPLKVLSPLADNSFVERAAIIIGLAFALSGFAPAAVGEWASGRSESSIADERSTFSLSDVSGYEGVPPGAATLPLPALPETGDHLPENAPGYTFRHDVPEVRLQFTVADEQGRLVQNVSADDVHILDNQSPVAHFKDFERADNLPLRLGLILDTSDSVQRVLPGEKAAAAKFLDQIMRPETDTAFVMAFGGDVRLWQTSTAKQQELQDAIARLKQPGWGTRFFDALYAACTGELNPGDDSKLVHRAIVVLSDGDDTESLRGLADVIAVAQRSEIQIYALTLHSRKAANRGDRVLQLLADATGGRLYVAQSSQDLGGALAQIEQDLRTQYYVSFLPQTSSPGFHSLRVEVRPPQKLEVHARQGYYELVQ